MGRRHPATTIIRTEKGPAGEATTASQGGQYRDITRIIYPGAARTAPGHFGGQLKFARDDGQTDARKSRKPKLNRQLDIGGMRPGQPDGQQHIGVKEQG